MKQASAPFSYLSFPGVISFLLTSTVALAAAFTTGCGGMSGSMGTGSNGNTSVTVLLTSTANNQLSGFNATFSNISLTTQSGKTVGLFATPQSAEFIHLNAAAEPLVTVNIPQGTYTAASATVVNATFNCVSLLPNNGGLQTSEFGSTSALTTTVTLPSPITVSGTAMGLLLNLQVAQSVTTSSCFLIGATYSITPSFNLTPVVLASPPSNFQNGKATGLEGQIASIATAGTGFNVTAADGPSWSVESDGNTVFQGVAGFATLAAGMPVNMDVVIQPDGSLLATRIAVEDMDTSNLTVWSGPLLVVAATEPVLMTVGVEEEGQFLSGGENFFSFGNAVFQISGQFTNLQSLPFAATFNAASMVDGQNVYISTHSLTSAPAPTYTTATTITLIPQTIDGTISEVSSVGTFTTYTVMLAPYDLFPDLAIQPGQTTVLTNPASVVVYVDNNTQLLNTKPLAAGTVARFNGLLFNDGGTLRMDCGQVNDGVAE